MQLDHCMERHRLGVPPTAMRCSGVLWVVLAIASVVNGASNGSSGGSSGRPIVPAVFALGDSIIDCGNNNGLETLMRCDFPPYGQDFAGHIPTGRFSNGKVPSDLIASGLGVKELLPPYLWHDLTDDDILTGVSFASGGSGFDPLTNSLVNVISMDEQLDMFEDYKRRLVEVTGEERAAEIIGGAFFVVCTGTNDVANTYFTSPFRRPHYDVPSYVDFLISHATAFLERLHGMGARIIGYVGLPPVGCVPSQRTIAGGLERRCDQARNEAAQLYNSRMQEEIGRLAGGAGYAGTRLVYIDIYNVLMDLIDNAAHYGFEESDIGCCGSGEYELMLTCNPGTGTCADVNRFVFWDSFHPTQSAYELIIRRILRDYGSKLFP